MAHHLQDLKVDFVSLVDRAAVRDPQNKSEPRRFLLWKREGTEDPTQQQKGDIMPEDLEARLQKAEEEAKAAVEKAEQERESREKAEAEAKENAEQLAKLEAAKPKDDDDANEETETAKAMKAELEKAEQARVALEKRVSDAEDIAKAERDRRLTGEFVAKAETFSSLPVEPAEFGPVLKRAAETLSKEDFETIDGLLKAANEQIAKGDLFKEMGAGVGGSALPDSAAAEIARKAQELRKADPKISLIDAEDHVLKGDRELQARYLAEQR